MRLNEQPLVRFSLWLLGEVEKSRMLENNKCKKKPYLGKKIMCKMLDIRCVCDFQVDISNIHFRSMGMVLRGRL